MTGRSIDLEALSSKERDALTEVEGLYEQRPDFVRPAFRANEAPPFFGKGR